jgi:hypothetical protein
MPQVASLVRISAHKHCKPEFAPCAYIDIAIEAPTPARHFGRQSQRGTPLKLGVRNARDHNRSASAPRTAQGISLEDRLLIETDEEYDISPGCRIRLSDIIASIGRPVARESTLAGQMSTAAWALSGPGRQVRKPAAFQVRIVDRGVVETVEIVRTVNEGHDIAGCVREVCESPRATTNLLTPLSDLVRSRTALIDGKWAPVVRSIVDLNRAIQEAAKHNIVRRRR